MIKHSKLNFAGTAKTFVMPQITNEVDLELLKIANFPSMVKANQALQRRIKKVKMSDIFVEKQVLGVDDVVYTVVPLNVAAIETSHERVEATTEEEKQMKLGHLEKLKKSSAFDVIYLSSDDVNHELEWFLSKFGVPKTTTSMKVEEPKVEPFTATQQAEAKAMFTEKGMTDAEIAEALDVKKSLVTKYLKTLING